MIILLHTSKTMRPPVTNIASGLSIPRLLEPAQVLNAYLRTLSAKKISSVMNVSPKLALTTKQLITDWTNDPVQQRAAVDSFLGDIYSGLQVLSWTKADRTYANDHLRILSGLYGILRPLDGIYPYRLETGYKLPAKKFRNAYEFWGSSIAETLPSGEPIINLAAVEYSKLVTKYLPAERFITPKFLTISPKTKQPVFVTVHAKIARGAFAHWLITKRINDPTKLTKFDALGYHFEPNLGDVATPVFVCQNFGGLGLSVRLK